LNVLVLASGPEPVQNAYNGEGRECDDLRARGTVYHWMTRDRGDTRSPRLDPAVVSESVPDYWRPLFDRLSESLRATCFNKPFKR